MIISISFFSVSVFVVVWGSDSVGNGGAFSRAANNEWVFDTDNSRGLNFSRLVSTARRCG